LQSFFVPARERLSGFAGGFGGFFRADTETVDGEKVLQGVEFGNQIGSVFGGGRFKVNTEDGGSIAFIGTGMDAEDKGSIFRENVRHVAEKTNAVQRLDDNPGLKARVIGGLPVYFD
jgi:hypothetical protein